MRTLLVAALSHAAAGSPANQDCVQDQRYARGDDTHCLMTVRG